MANEIQADESRSLERQKLVWEKEQQAVASLVEVLPSHFSKCSSDSQSARAEKDSPTFQVVPPLGAHISSDDWYGGVDVSFPDPSSDDNNLAVAVYVIIDRRTMKVVYRDHEWYDASIVPYISTFLAFREIDPLERLIAKQCRERPQMTPAAIFVDGNGIYHPRSAGIACFVGVRTNIPSIGIGKTLLYIPTHDDGVVDELCWTRESLANHIRAVVRDLRPQIVDKVDKGNIDGIPQNGDSDLSRGLIWSKLRQACSLESDTSFDLPTKVTQDLIKDIGRKYQGIAIPLSKQIDGDDPLGVALFGHGGCGNQPPSKRPIIVSVGHKLSLLDAVRITAALSLHRVPEPVRQADLYGRQLIRETKRR